MAGRYGKALLICLLAGEQFSVEEAGGGVGGEVEEKGKGEDCG